MATKWPHGIQTRREDRHARGRGGRGTRSGSSAHPGTDVRRTGLQLGLLDNGRASVARVKLLNHTASVVVLRVVGRVLVAGREGPRGKVPAGPAHGRVQPERESGGRGRGRGWVVGRSGRGRGGGGDRVGLGLGKLRRDGVVGSRRGSCGPTGRLVFAADALLGATPSVALLPVLQLLLVDQHVLNQGFLFLELGRTQVAVVPGRKSECI
jgi:hypothetical protein